MKACKPIDVPVKQASAPSSDAPLAGLLRLPQVLQLIPVSASTLWLWVREGKFPQPLRLGGRVTVWRASDIQRVIAGENKF